jgi:CheY-like chemotaxis protein
MDLIVVDDDPDICDILKHILEELGHNVNSFSSGFAALSYLENDEHENLDVIISDIFMPGMDGIQLTKKIRNISKEIPIIIISAGGQKNLKAFEQAKLEGANILLEKPFGIESIEDALELISK